MKAFRFIYLIPLLLFLLVPCKAYSQDEFNKMGWGIGFSAGVINTSLASGGEYFFEDINPFLLDRDSYLSLRLNLQYDFSDYESIRADISSGKFTVLTNFAGWPEYTFTNDFINSTISVQMSLMRYLGIPAYPLNIYGKFGLGLNFNNLTANPRNSNQGLVSNKKNTQNPVYVFGGGLRLYISQSVNLYTEYDLFLSDRQIIESGFVSDFTNSDFSRTSSRWRGLQAGIQIKFQNRTGSGIRQPPQPIFADIPPQPPSFKDYFETISVERPSVSSLKSLDYVLNGLIQENTIRFLTYSWIESPVQIIDTKADYEVTTETVTEITTTNDLQPLTVDDLHINTISSAISEYGTTGNWNTDIQDGYTIVIHSVLNINQANRIANELSDSGYRAFVIPTIINNTSYYRVVIGQYDSRYRAIQAANHLPPTIRNQYFLMSFH